MPASNRSSSSSDRSRSGRAEASRKEIKDKEPVSKKGKVEKHGSENREILDAIRSSKKDLSKKIKDLENDAKERLLEADEFSIDGLVSLKDIMR